MTIKSWLLPMVVVLSVAGCGSSNYTVYVNNRSANTFDSIAIHIASS